MMAEMLDVRAPERAEAGAVAHLAGAVVLGAVVAVDPDGWYPFGPAKWWVVSTAIVAAAAVAGRDRAVVGSLARSRRRGPVLLVWLAVAAALGRDPLYAWIGTPERHLGWITWVLLALSCWVGTALAERAALVRWTRWVVVAAAWCGVYVLVERWWGAPVAWVGATSRSGGPFGSAAYLGAALCLLVPVSAGVALDRCEGARWRVLAWVGAATGAIGLVGSGTRGAWIGLVIGAGTVVLAGHRPTRRGWAVVGVVVIAALAVVGPRLDDVVSRTTPASSRLDEWSMAGRAIAERPLLGAGPEGYRTVVAEVVTPEYERTYGRDVVPDRAHDGVLDVAVTGGVPAAIAYLVLVGARAACRMASGAHRRCAPCRAGGGRDRLPRTAVLPVPARRARPDPVARRGRAAGDRSSR